MGLTPLACPRTDRDLGDLQATRDAVDRMVQQALEEAQQKYMAAVDVKRRPAPVFKVGQRMMVRSAVLLLYILFFLSNLFTTPFLVRTLLNIYIYMLQLCCNFCFQLFFQVRSELYPNSA
jgi:hypothetical protein